MINMKKKSISRRQFLQIIAVGGIAGATVKLSSDAWNRMVPISETRLLMGTVVNLTVVCDDPSKARVAVQACLKLFRERGFDFQESTP